MIKRRNQIETGNQIVDQRTTENSIIYLSIANQIHILSLIPVLDFFRLGLVNYSLVFLAWNQALLLFALRPRRNFKILAENPLNFLSSFSGILLIILHSIQIRLEFCKVIKDAL